ncbi:PP2C family serine/threonine-protein phosphatase [Spirulina sp. CS-785/01]|uniref:PP2C family serine/threonine-protein phosphatase n=1 Tax=Spirulina sp. CS-785/01 TaxID=3021716 RepID=UPI00232E01D1|nr:PP2C family serine/threonine-protein phosphatase [Spirulina sp. CS-785/01]MDB9313119.1 PP2C family serine/threonine-protein phosphatase [Spirulina sp. CS-785/01]
MPNYSPPLSHRRPWFPSQRLIKVMADELSPQNTVKWQYNPIPPHEPDPHSESFCQTLKTPHHYTLLGARVRGKKHKHEGTNCDDWFTCSTSGDWTIIAVADGAGSRPFSRVGARVSCEASVGYLEDRLKGLKLQKRELWSVDTFQRQEDTGAFLAEDLEAVQCALHEAMRVAYNAVDKAVQQRHPYTKYYISLGHRYIELNDLAATLILVVQTTVNYKNTEYSLLFTCQVGDGITVALDNEGNIQPLSCPDSGSFSGETEFLVTEGKLERDVLMRKTFPFFRPLKALFVMTDGVADDYFPIEKQAKTLYGDLLLNGIIELSLDSDNRFWGYLDQLEQQKHHFTSLVHPLTSPENSPQPISIYSSRKLARTLGFSLPDLIATPQLLTVARKLDKNNPTPPPEKLKLWLDNYTKKGSFDDRTVVILHR